MDRVTTKALLSLEGVTQFEKQQGSKKKAAKKKKNMLVACCLLEFDNHLEK